MTHFEGRALVGTEQIQVFEESEGMMEGRGTS
jgi:hypothetical protein